MTLSPPRTRRPRALALLAALGAAALAVSTTIPAAPVDPAHEAAAALARRPVAQADRDASLTNDEVAVATLDPSGLPERAVLISRLTSHGPRREIVDPASVTNVQYLDRVGRPGTTPEGVRLTVGGAWPLVLTRARFDRPMPVAVHVQYALDDRVVAPDEVPGASGALTVTYTMTNTTARDQDLDHLDAAGNPATSRRPVFAPFQGSLTVTLPEGVELVSAPGAMPSTDERGRGVLRWNVSLYPPVSSPQQEAALHVRADRLGIPAARITLTPAGVDRDPATDLAGELLAGAVAGNADLHGGLTELDRGADAVAEGTGGLATGLGQLADGARGIAGAGRALAAGVDDLSDGAGALASGAATLADGLGDAATAAEALRTATARLAEAAPADSAGAAAQLGEGADRLVAGLEVLVARLGSPGDPPLPGPPDEPEGCTGPDPGPYDAACPTLLQGLRALRDGLADVDGLATAMATQAVAADEAARVVVAALGGIGSDAAAAAQGAAGLMAALCATPPVLDPASCTQLSAVAAASGSAAAGAATATPDATALLTATGTLRAQAGLLRDATGPSVAAAERLLVAVAALSASAGRGSASQPGLLAGADALAAGLDELAAGLAAGAAGLRSGLASLASGAGLLAEGVVSAEDAADRVAEGSGALADGAARVAGGGEQLAEGATGLARGSERSASAGSALADGAARVADATAAAARTVLDASVEPALAEAWLAAAGARAADALPYGAPDGATGTAAYLFTIEEVAAPLGPWDRLRRLLGR